MLLALEEESDDPLDELRSWCEVNGVRVDETVEVRRGEDGLGVFAKADIPTGTIIASIPKSVIITLESCTMSKLLGPFLEDLDRNIALAVILLSEQLLGRESRWYQYLKCLPKEIGLPEFWPETATRWLEGTEVVDLMDRSTLFVKLEYAWELVSATLMQLHPTWDRLVLAYEQVSSRNFALDGQNRAGIVPFADAFNHAQNWNVHVEIDQDACQDCGVVHDSDNNCPSFSGEGNTVLAKVPMFDIISCTDIAAGSEICACYCDGPASNADLLCRYGFFLADNKADSLIFTSADLKILGEADEHLFAAITDCLPVTDLCAVGTGDYVEWHNVQGSVSADTYFVTSSGRISVGLFVYAFCSSCPIVGPSTHSLPHILRLFTTTYMLLAEYERAKIGGNPLRRWGYLGLDVEVLLLRKIAMVIGTLCEHRQQATFQQHLSADDLARILESSDELGLYERVAISYAMMERSIVGRSLALWLDVESYLSDELRN